MKTILVPVDPIIDMTSSLACAALLGQRFQSSIDGVALRPAFAEIMAPDPIVAVTIPPSNWDEGQFQQQARAKFDKGAAGHTMFRWRGTSTVDDATLGLMARVYDVTVMPRPGSKGSRMTAFETALFDSGRPLLMAPPAAPKTLGDAIIIHWNHSTETARTIAMTLPLLQKAHRVLVLQVEGNGVPGPTARDATGYLIANGVPATDRIVDPKGRGPGETILTEAKNFEADLLLKGAYTQSRLRQMIFGGATSHILARAELPVLLAH